MKLSTIFLVGVLSLLALFVAGVDVAERLHTPHGGLVLILKVVYAPTFRSLDLIGTKGKAAGNKCAVGVLGMAGVLLLTPAVYSGLTVAAVAIIRRRRLANKRRQGTLRAPAA